MKIDLNRFKTMESYTFDEGVAFLILCSVPLGVIGHLKSTHNRNNLHAEIHKALRMPGTMRLLKEKGVLRRQAPAVPKPKETVPEPAENVRKSAESVPETPEKEPDQDKHVPESDESGTDGSDGLTITMEDVLSHKYTRYDQMPNDITRKLYLKKEELFHEMQQNHLKMSNVPEGEEHDGERAEYRAEVMRLDKEVEDKWKLIDAEIQRFVTENERPEKGRKEGQKDSSFNISTYRAYISKATRKKQLTDAQFVELQHRVDALIASGEELEPETVGKLKAIGIKFPG